MPEVLLAAGREEAVDWEVWLDLETQVAGRYQVQLRRKGLSSGDGFTASGIPEMTEVRAMLAPLAGLPPSPVLLFAVIPEGITIVSLTDMTELERSVRLRVTGVPEVPQIVVEKIVAEPVRIRVYQTAKDAETGIAVADITMQSVASPSLEALRASGPIGTITRQLGEPQGVDDPEP